MSRSRYKMSKFLTHLNIFPAKHVKLVILYLKLLDTRHPDTRQIKAIKKEPFRLFNLIGGT